VTGMSMSWWTAKTGLLFLWRCQRVLKTWPRLSTDKTLASKLRTRAQGQGQTQIPNKSRVWEALPTRVLGVLRMNEPQPARAAVY